MYITLELENAIQMVDYINHCGERVCAKAIAEQTGISKRFALKILCKLSSAQIIRSYKGVNGGYELNRKPEDLSLLDIWEAVNEKVSFSKCVDSNVCQKGNITDNCKFHSIFAHLSDTIRRELAEITFDQISEFGGKTDMESGPEALQCK